LSPDSEISAFSGKLEMTRFFRKSLFVSLIRTLDDSGQNQQKSLVQITKALLYQLS